MSLAVLERNKQKYSGTRVIKAGLKLVCYEKYYGFTLHKEYRIKEINDGYITVIDDDKIAVIFLNKEELKSYFYILFK